MRHRKKGLKLGRNTKKRQALFKGLARSLILKEAILTTEAKAKAVKGLVDKLISRAQKGSLSSRRQLLAFLPDKTAVHKLFDDIAPRTKKRLSGFTRLIRVGRRVGDNAMMARLELVDKAPPKAKTKGRTLKGKTAKRSGQPERSEGRSDLKVKSATPQAPEEKTERRGLFARYLKKAGRQKH
ncbi:MAG: 50S ribosomal protein L17 [Candidatus Beckwithbacteria bacterium GW2011_GWB1_47_15]|uniref:Large ribosomal subunit protein bL17 n=1 Tax=Candidatus Beckwithbacteria bacterium GW2011_GWB1_47_15 TaxID=1618371 RepID=A0A0G1RXS5_9BACT|nr:MAG: 50S ribosomal protein L17, large subunit ribosomal protein L17 [Candidatus Beckwithbacteria bacterium GW2011_GWC1_49_16]AQS30772.1 hypothetical protein [uncultured bacterium]KKU35957.1 MAG: 50S ribosomal protein L17 [Candidatus Beckwithbacteria bacterium GW2011_GWA1_46_30]KKU61921.1 MAG: 50S ribosomal protein L17 [Candidatus Beckwithbacteria bacterium GW2011_GWB1_47_15]KKU72525.1 MAG: 50S ribosomal protein L17 [Candidatus Beckwithbacteria bacterium GW2011_GWA2_47_25]KKW04308.1 MAG: 50S